MPVAPAFPISLTATQRHRLKEMAHGHKTPHQARIRVHVVLHAARGRSNARIARETGLHLDTVRTWRSRFAEEGRPGLTDRKRPGRPPHVHRAAGRPGQGAGLWAARRDRYKRRRPGMSDAGFAADAAAVAADLARLKGSAEAARRPGQWASASADAVTD